MNIIKAIGRDSFTLRAKNSDGVGASDVDVLIEEGNLASRRKDRKSGSVLVREFFLPKRRACFV